MKERILLIQYFYKPFNSNQSFRYEKIFDSLKKEYQIDILTSHHKGLKIHETIDDINIYRTNVGLLRKDLSKSSSRNTIYVSKNRIIRKFFRSLWWPDFAFPWLLKAYKLGCKLIKRNNYNIIITGSFPFTSHLVGLWLKIKFSNFKWIVDYIDPFSIIGKNENSSNNVRLYKRLNIWSEKIVNRKADRILIFNEAKEAFYQLFPKSKHKTIIVPSMLGIDLDVFNSYNKKEFEKNQIHILYLGQLYSDIRNPIRFLEFFSELLKFRSNLILHFVGNLNNCEDMIFEFLKKYRNNIKIWGKVSRKEGIRFLKGANVLLNISNDSRYQLPGKIVEYVYSRKKIINFSNKPNSNSEKFLKSYDPEEKRYISIGSFIKMNINIIKVLKLLDSENEFDVDMNKHLPQNIAKYYTD